MEKKSARSGALGESRAEIHRTRNVKSLAHAAQPSVESRDARRTVSDVKDAAAILMRWNQYVDNLLHCGKAGFLRFMRPGCDVVL